MDTKTQDYEFTKIEPNWQKYWDDHKTFRAVADPAKPKFYVLDMFPYPSGVGLHVGHPLGYVGTDIYARFKRMKGFNVLHTMGFDAFGLPAEQFAIENGVHPSVSTDRNIETMRRQLYRIGLGYDTERSLSSTDIGYYRWTQWIFLKLFNSTFDPCQQKTRPLDELRSDLDAGRYGFDPETLELQTEPTPEAVSTWKNASESERRRLLDSQRLAYMAEIPVNWCPALGTVLAKSQEFALSGVPVRTVTLLITDGADVHSTRASARHVASLVEDMLMAETHIVAAMGIDDGDTDFRAAFREMGIPDAWILTPGNSAGEVRLLKIHIGQVRAAKRCVREIRPLEIRASQVGVGETCAGEILAAKIGSREPLPREADTIVHDIDIA